jgi:hypothetical protein
VVLALCVAEDHRLLETGMINRAGSRQLPPAFLGEPGWEFARLILSVGVFEL